MSFFVSLSGTYINGEDSPTKFRCNLLGMEKQAMDQAISRSGLSLLGSALLFLSDLYQTYSSNSYAIFTYTEYSVIIIGWTRPENLISEIP